MVERRVGCVRIDGGYELKGVFFSTRGICWLGRMWFLSFLITLFFFSFGGKLCTVL
jgi:hypothetical protein